MRGASRLAVAALQVWQFDLWNQELSNTAIQADNYLWPQPDRGLLQTFPAPKVNIYLRAEFP